jgi:hypothetical protein
VLSQRVSAALPDSAVWNTRHAESDRGSRVEYRPFTASTKRSEYRHAWDLLMASSVLTSLTKVDHGAPERFCVGGRGGDSD